MDIKKRAAFIIHHNTPSEIATSIWMDYNTKGESVIYNQRKSCYDIDKQGEGYKTIKNKFMAEDLDRIGLNICRRCKTKIEPYETNYFETMFDETGKRQYKLYCFENGYCEECAKKAQETINKQPPFICITKEFETWIAGDNFPTTHYIFNDGSEVEDNPDNSKGIEL